MYKHLKTKIMYNEQLEQLIDAALADGVLTEKEKQILFKKAQTFGIDLDEFEMVLDARLFKLQKEQQSSAPKSNKFGDVKKCPACGAMVETFNTRCLECGHTFSNIETNESIERLFKILNDIESRTIETNVNAWRKAFLGDEEFQKRHDMKIAAIQNFPIPTTKDDILEFLAQAVPLSKKPGFWDADSNWATIELAATWKKKCEQIIIKANFAMRNDKEILEEINAYADLLKIKIK